LVPRGVDFRAAAVEIRLSLPGAVSCPWCTPSGTIPSRSGEMPLAHPALVEAAAGTALVRLERLLAGGQARSDGIRVQVQLDGTLAFSPAPGLAKNQPPHCPHLGRGDLGPWNFTAALAIATAAGDATVTATR
jgi:hypothetical protein